MDKRSDLIIVMIVIGLDIFYYYLAEELPKAYIDDSLGAAGYPKLLAACLFLLSALLFFTQLRRWRREPGWIVSPEGESDNPNFPASNFRVVFLIITIFLYLFSMPIIGYLFATPIFLTAVFLLTRARNFRFLLVVSSIFTLALFIIFAVLARVRLPMGFLDFLNDFIAQLYIS